MIIKNECWICVDKDGTEQIRDRKPKRFFGTKKERENEILSYEDSNKKNIWISDYDYLDKYDFPKLGEITKKIILPKGTIEKILGHSLTFEDDAIQLK